jgi:DNA polymerase-1
MKVFLIDGHSLLFRAHYAFFRNPLVTQKGQVTSALFGFMGMFSSVLKNHKPDKVIFAFDLSKKTFRNELFTDYKANRSATPDEIREQTPLAMELLTAMGYEIVTREGFEADDVIGTLSARFAENKDEVTIVTGDRDSLQLINEHVTVLLTKKGISETVTCNPEYIKEKYGLTPHQLIDVKALQGDSSDNIPGVPGIGEKGALKLISDYENLENLYENINDFKGKRKQCLEENKELAYLCRKLGTIDTSIETLNSIDVLSEPPVDIRKTADMLSDLELTRYASCTRGGFEAPLPDSSWPPEPSGPSIVPVGQGTLFGGPVIEESSPSGKQSTFSETADTDGSPQASVGNFPGAGTDYSEVTPPAVEEDRNVSYTTVVSVNRLKKLKDIIRKATVLALDTETTSADPLTAALAGMSFSVKEGEAWYLPLIHGSNKTALEKDEAFSTPEKIIASVKDLLERPDLKITGHNIKFDYKVLKKHGIHLRNIVFDTMLGGYLLEPSGRRYSLKAMALKWLNHNMIEFKDLIATRAHFGEIPLDEATPYACDDAETSLRLYNIIKPELEKANLTSLFEDLEMKLIPILGDMETTGIKIDIDFLKNLGKQFEQKMQKIETSVYKLAGREFNLKSPKQLAEILFDELGYTPVKKTKGGSVSTDSFVLESLDSEQNCELARQILHHRHYAKLTGTYIEPMPLMVDSHGKIHTSFNQTRTETGRLSSVDPNLQNIPIRSEDGQKIREAFIPTSEENVFVSADYSQVELRILAHYSKSPILIDAFKNGRDIHRETAARVFQVSPQEVTSEMRSKAKAVNFGILYGQTGFGLARELNISRAEAKEMIDKYFESMPYIHKWKEKTILEAVDRGFVSTILGRHRFLPDLAKKPTNPAFKAAEREAINTIIQGSAADLIKKAMIDLSIRLKKEGLNSSILLQVHDELILECPRNESMTVKKVLKEVMESAMVLNVPLTVSVSEGTNWAMLK